MNQPSFTRRSFLKTSALAATALAFPFVSRARVLGANGRLNIASVGAGGKAAVDTSFCAGENIIGLCDVDAGRLTKTGGLYPSAQRFADWRVMFDQLGKEIDAVTVGTLDHTHFHPSYRAVKMGKHVFCQKPLTHTVWEARTLTEAARKAKVATQMGNQGISHPKLRRARNSSRLASSATCRRFTSGRIAPASGGSKVCKLRRSFRRCRRT